jgi:NADH-quinone oxidoreductase subunit E
MCILSPKLVAAGKHPNITLYTNSEITSLTGEEGDFHATIAKKPRYVDETKCTGCGACSLTCPVLYKFQTPEPVSASEQIIGDDLARLDAIMDKYEDEKGILISVLQDITNEFNYLPESVLRYVSERLDVPLSQVYNVATFYTSFSLEPRGDHVIRVCQGTACHVRGGARVLGEIERILGIKAGETTPDLGFTLETVNCLGCCALGPVVVIDEEYNPTTPKDVQGLLKKYGESGGGEKP